MEPRKTDNRRPSVQEPKDMVETTRATTDRPLGVAVAVERDHDVIVYLWLLSMALWQRFLIYTLYMMCVDPLKEK